MQYPSIFIYTNKVNAFENHEVIHVMDFSIVYSQKINENVIIKESESCFIFAHVNVAFRKELVHLDDYNKLIQTDFSLFVDKFTWGFLVVINKVTNELQIINDPYGIYPLYYFQSKENIITISNDFHSLINHQNNLHLDYNGVYDYFLFNYTLKSRTLIREIKQFEGGTKFSYLNREFNIHSYIDILEYILKKSDSKSIDDMSNALENNILDNLDLNLPCELPLTGGFDTKVVLSVLLKKKIDFHTYTFGDADSDDNIAAKAIKNQFNLNHDYLNSNEYFELEFDKSFKEFLRCSPNAPILQTLLQYHLVKSKIPNSNLITGKMGGELIVGPILVSELITTKGSAELLETKNNQIDDDLSKRLGNIIEELGFLDLNEFNKQYSNYILPLKSYFKTKSNLKNENVIEFLLKETYPKFFGVVFSNLFSNFNMVNPFVDVKFLRALYNSNYSFINKEAFKKAPLSHFRSRRIYPLLIKKIYAKVLKSKMDRGYKLEDFLFWYKYPRPILNYFKRHLNKKKAIINKNDYMIELKAMAAQIPENSHLYNLKIINNNNLSDLINNVKNNKSTSMENQKIIQLLTLDYFLNCYSDKITL